RGGGPPPRDAVRPGGRRLPGVAPRGPGRPLPRRDVGVRYQPADARRRVPRRLIVACAVQSGGAAPGSRARRRRRRPGAHRPLARVQLRRRRIRMTGRRRGRPMPPRSAKRSTLTARTKHSTVPKGSLDTISKPPKVARPSTKRIARIVDDESSLLDLIDNLLAKGVMLNADLILALANVDLVYVRLSALLCAADRVLGPGGQRG